MINTEKNRTKLITTLIFFKRIDRVTGYVRVAGDDNNRGFNSRFSSTQGVVDPEKN